MRSTTPTYSWTLVVLIQRVVPLMSYCTICNYRKVSTKHVKDLGMSNLCTVCTKHHKALATRAGKTTQGHAYRGTRPLLHVWDIGQHGSYPAAHNQAKAMRGRASDYACITCWTTHEHLPILARLEATAMAEEWALVKARHKGTVKRYGSDCSVEWSMNPYDYAPMCKQCHVALDNATRATRRKAKAFANAA